MTFRLYDTRTRQVRDLVPVEPGKVSIYHCGLTVQAPPHLGHIRKEVVFDLLRRWLTATGYEVTVIANVTDIDDKILAKSAEAGVPWFAHAYRYERELHDAYAALGCRPPTYEPRATGHVPEMLELIEILIRRGHAYHAEDGSGDVYFDVRSWPDYGSLSGQRIDDMEAAADADPRGKRDPRDFALWKGHKPEAPISASWPTPWGRGRPGWHLECSAMAGKYLGDEFDIHGGGIELRFPHHENELAQSCAAGRPFARYWMHNAWVTAAGEKMSKSLGNGALVAEVTKRFPPRAVRFFLLAPHYRSAVEFSDSMVAESAAALDRIDGFLARAGEVAGSPGRRIPDEFAAALDDDLGTPRAVAVLNASVRAGNIALEAGDGDEVATRLAEVRGMLDVFGLDPDDPVWAQAAGAADTAGLTALADGLVAELLTQREAARARRDFAAADAIRDALAALGVEVADTLAVRAGPSLRSRRRSRDAREQPAQGRSTPQGQGQHRGVRRPGPARPRGEGPTPKAEDRPYHPAHRRRQAASQGGGARTGSKGGGARTGRPGSGAEWVVGRNAVLEALDARLPIRTAYVAEGAERDDRLRDILRVAADRRLALLEVTRAELDRLTGGAVHQGVALQLPAYEYVHPDDLLAEALAADAAPVLVALDSITDPRNLGAVVRSAAAFGAAGVLIPERRAAGMTAAAWKTSAGAAARIPIARATNLNRTLRAYADAGCRLVGLDADAERRLEDLGAATEPLVLVVGSEGEGLSRLVREACDEVVAIPVSAAVESLNAGVAAGIALYEISRRSRSGIGR